MLRRIVIIRLQKNFELLLNGSENGDKTNWKYLNQQLFEPTVKPNNTRLEGGGRKPLDQQLENQLV